MALRAVPCAACQWWAQGRLPSAAQRHLAPPPSLPGTTAAILPWCLGLASARRQRRLLALLASTPPLRARTRAAAATAAGAAAAAEAGDAPSEGSAASSDEVPAESGSAGDKKKKKKKSGGVIEDVEYIFVNTHEDEARRIPEDVLQRLNTVSRAQQGCYKVPDGVPDTEHGVGALTGALKNFPAQHEFQVVGKTGSAQEREEFLRLVSSAIVQHTGELLSQDCISVRERMGGKYTSVTVRQQVARAEQIGLVLDELGKLPQVVMRF